MGAVSVSGVGVKGLADRFEPGIGCQEHFEHGGDQCFRLFLLAIGVLINRRIVGECRGEIRLDRDGYADGRFFPTI